MNEQFWRILPYQASLVAQMVKHLPAMQETQVWSLVWEDPLEKEMATHSSTLAWRIPWTEEPGRLQSRGLQRVGHDWMTSLSFPYHVRNYLVKVHIVSIKVSLLLLNLEWRLTEFCQKNTLVTANTLCQHKRWLYTWTSPDGQYQNQSDYILLSQRWRSSIQSAKTRLGVDCGSDHGCLIVKFRLKMKKIGKTTRPFRHDLNQIS